METSKVILKVSDRKADSLQALFASWMFIDIFFRMKQLPKRLLDHHCPYWQTNQVVWLVNNVCYFKRILFSKVTS